MNDKCCCSHKTKERTPDEYKKLIHRLNRIEGQIRGIRGMVENNAYCTDILVQVSAVNAALNAFHLSSCWQYIFHESLLLYTNHYFLFWQKYYY